MMNMEGMGWMMPAGRGLIGTLVIVLLVLGTAALVTKGIISNRSLPSSFSRNVMRFLVGRCSDTLFRLSNYLFFWKQKELDGTVL